MDESVAVCVPPLLRQQGQIQQQQNNNIVISMTNCCIEIFNISISFEAMFLNSVKIINPTMNHLTLIKSATLHYPIKIMGTQNFYF